MNRRWWLYWLLVLLTLAAMLISGCSSGGGTTGDSSEPYEEPDLSGVWLGDFSSNPKSNAVFAVGIIVPNEDGYYAWYMADDRIYTSPASSPLSLSPNSAIFSGDLDEYSWTGIAPSYAASRESLFMIGSAATKGFMGVVGFPGGAYTYTTKDESGAFVFFYNTTYTVPPNVGNVGGSWEIAEGGVDGGTTINLTITPSLTDTKGGSINGSDNRGNSFAGTISIRYTPEPRNVYTVSMKLNDTIDLTGLATYILEMHTNGISLPKKTLAIGATSDDHTYSMSGLAKKK